MVTQCSGGNSQKGSRYFILSGLSLLRPVDTKTDFNLNNIIATPPLISISLVKKFTGKCPQTWSQLCSMNAKVSIHAQSYAALVYCKPINVFSTMSLESQESYLTRGMVPYKHFSQSLKILSTCTVFSHSSIILLPRQLHVFARLARWQLGYYPCFWIFWQESFAACSLRLGLTCLQDSLPHLSLVYTWWEPRDTDSSDIQ